MMDFTQLNDTIDGAGDKVSRHLNIIVCTIPIMLNCRPTVNLIYLLTSSKPYSSLPKYACGW